MVMVRHQTYINIYATSYNIAPFTRYSTLRFFFFFVIHHAHDVRFEGVPSTPRVYWYILFCVFLFYDYCFVLSSSSRVCVFFFVCVYYYICIRKNNEFILFSVLSLIWFNTFLYTTNSIYITAVCIACLRDWHTLWYFRRERQGVTAARQHASKMCQSASRKRERERKYLGII